MAEPEDPPHVHGEADRPSVFISYRRQDADAANKLSTLCEKAGLKPWTDQAIQAGENWRAKIEAAVESCDIFVLLLSAPDKQAEAATPLEWSYICERRWNNPHVLVVPIRLDSTPLPAFVANNEYLNAPDGPALSRCVNEICHVSLDRHRTMPLRQSQFAARRDTSARFKQLVEAIRSTTERLQTDTDPDASK